VALNTWQHLAQTASTPSTVLVPAPSAAESQQRAGPPPAPASAGASGVAPNGEASAAQAEQRSAHKRPRASDGSS
jgi:hypothetical protein